MKWLILASVHTVIIINEKTDVAFSRRTARTCNSHKKSRENVVSNSTEEEKNSPSVLTWENVYSTL